MRRHAIDAQDALHVPAEVVAVELDLEVRQAVGAIQSPQRLGQAVADRLRDIAAVQRVERRRGDTAACVGSRLAADEAAERLARELRPEIVAKVVDS